MKLYLIEPTIVDGEKVLTITLEDIAEELYFWGTILFGHVVALIAKPSLGFPSGWYIYRFACKEDADFEWRLEVGLLIERIFQI